jgi:hypothetical protein
MSRGESISRSKQPEEKHGLIIGRIIKVKKNVVHNEVVGSISSALQIKPSH